MTKYIDDSGKVLMSLNDNKDEIIKISSLPKEEQEEILYLVNLDFDINWAGL